jgi:hypothetical protein
VEAHYEYIPPVAVVPATLPTMIGSGSPTLFTVNVVVLIRTHLNQNDWWNRKHRRLSRLVSDGIRDQLADLDPGEIVSRLLIAGLVASELASVTELPAEGVNDALRGHILGAPGESQFRDSRVIYWWCDSHSFLEFST